MKKVHSKEKLKLRIDTIRHLREVGERELREVNGGGADDTHTGLSFCTSTLLTIGG